MTFSTASPVPTARIRVLPDDLVDQIAAGEVVERPASVVKELVENSLDARATSIRIDVRDGGAALVAVQDDGIGMSPEEIPLALSRHATSKLVCFDDLARIASFGFRGEALPAIASVSRFRIMSRARGAEAGHEILVEAGRILASRAAGGQEGTRIEVADLFAAIPARRKFLKRASTEWSHISDWLARLAMARPEIHFEIRRDDREPTIWPACLDRRDRLALLLPEEDAAGLIAVDRESSIGRIHGFVSTPEYSRANGLGLHLFVNGRPVRDRLLHHALCEPYRDLLPRGRYPVGVLFVDVEPGTVDVNVHPAKWEVRFSDPQSIHRGIRHAVRESIAARRWLALTPLTGAEVGAAAADRFTPSPLAGDGDGDEQGAYSARPLPLEVRERRVAGGVGAVGEWWGRASGQGSSMGPPIDWTLAGDPPAQQEAATPAPPVASFAGLRWLGQLHASYLLAEGPEGLVIVDQHAAHERILYERLRQAWLENGVARQGLLQPQVLKVSAATVAAVEEAADVVSRMGFDLEVFGDDALLVRAVPAELGSQDPEALVRDLAAALIEGERGSDDLDASAVRWLPALDRMFATLACHSARRFGDRLPEAEQRSILTGLDTIPWAPSCPHGRPVAILLDQNDLEARFARR